MYKSSFFLPGQCFIKQDFFEMLWPMQSLPPFLAVVALVLFRKLYPFPHDLEHAVHCPHLDQ